VHASRWALTAVAAAGAAVALLLLLWAASAGPGQLASGGPRAHTAVATVTASPSAPAAAARQALRRPLKGAARPLDLAWLGQLVEAALLLGACWLGWLLVRWLRDRQLAREHEKRLDASFEALPEPEAVAERIQADRDAQVDRLTEGSPRNGIVGCWILMEEGARELGVGPRASETPTEFLTRLLHRLDVDPRPPARLAQLYHVARFSSHPLTEEDRHAAREALDALHADLAVLRAAGSVR
jgi:hypothetical protein